MLRSKNSTGSFHHSSHLNDSSFSVDSDTGTALPENRPAFTLRVINPDFYEEDNEPVVQPYKPTLVANSVSSTPELRHATVQQKPQSTTVIAVSPVNSPNAWQNENNYSFSDVATPTSPRSPQQQPTVTRKVSKILVEPSPNVTKELELLPPLETLPPMFSVNESHLLSPSTPGSGTVVNANNGDLSPTTLNQISPLEALSIKSNSSISPPPVLPQHGSDYFFNKGSSSVAQQSINAMVINTAVKSKSPAEESATNSHREVVNLPPAPLTNTTTASTPIPTMYNYNEQADRRSSKDLLNEQKTRSISPPPPNPHRPPQHARTPSVTPSMSASITGNINTAQHQLNGASSRYSKASYSLTNNPEAIKLYRTMAMKTGDPTVQLTYAKYLLEVACLYDSKDKRQHFKPNLSLSLPILKRPSGLNGRPSSIASSRRSSMDTHASFNTFTRRDSSGTMMNLPSVDDEESSKKKKKKMLEEEGVRWIKKLAKQNVGEAAYLLGLWHDRGMYGCRKSVTKALKNYEIAANAKIPEAMFAVGQYHEREQDYMTSFKLYEEAASLGLVEALYRIAMINLNGEFGSRRNITGAIQLLMRASEKSTGNCPEAPFTLGLLLVNDYPGLNIPNELIQTYGGTFAATTYLEHAAEMGMSAAQYRLGCMYEQGLYGVRANLAKAVEYYELAANTNNNGYAMLALSRLYNQGIQVPHEQSEEQMAIFEKDESGWLRTQRRDEDAAFRWCHLAADQNIPDACYLLGWYYEVGIGIPRDFQHAHHFYSKAAKKGNHKEAQDRVNLLESMVKHQKNEKRRTMAQEKKRASNANILSPQNNNESKSNSKSKDSQCVIM